MRRGPYRPRRRERRFSRRRLRARGTRARRRTPSSPRGSSLTTAKSSARALAPRRYASTPSRARFRMGERPPARTARSCHAGAPPRAFRWRTSRRGRRERALARRGGAPRACVAGAARSRPTRREPDRPPRASRRSLLRQLRLGGHLSCVGDLAHDLDDVAVRVEDAQLPVGPVSVRQDLVDYLELSFRPELARVWLDFFERPADQLRDGNAIAPSRRQIHQRSLEAVASGEPLVLGRQDPVIRRDLLTALELLRVQLDKCLAVRNERNDVLHPRDRVADADLDRP